MLLDQFTVVFIDIDQSIICNGNDSSSRITVYGTERSNLFYIDLFQTCQLSQDSFGSIVHAFIFLHKTAHQRPLAFGRLKVSFQQEKAQFSFAETENNAVYRNIELRINIIICCHSRNIKYNYQK